jgi:hypothetical protein
MFGGMGRKMFPSAGNTVQDGYLIHVGPAVDPGDSPAMIGQVSATQYSMPMTGHRWVLALLGIGISGHVGFSGHCLTSLYVQSISVNTSQGLFRPFTRCEAIYLLDQTKKESTFSTVR